jgi:hypothetical protein
MRPEPASIRKSGQSPGYPIGDEGAEPPYEVVLAVVEPLYQWPARSTALACTLRVRRLYL